jgi:hypothetical protein
MIANRLAGDPVWLMVVGSPGSGKTEVIQSTGGLDEVRGVSALTGTTLLSGKVGSKNAPPKSLLHRMDEAGESMLVLKDFGTILSLHHETRAQVLAALREIYDGEYVRETGMGFTLRWKGRIGFVAGVTPAIELHSSVIGALGERFIYLRLPEVNQKKMSDAALKEDDAVGMRRELQDAMVEFVESTNLADVPTPTDAVKEHLSYLARKTAWLRTSVPRDSYGNRDILMRPAREAPTRVAKQFRQMWRAATLIGHEDPLAFVRRIGNDSTTPADRVMAVEFMVASGQASTTEIRKHLGLPHTTAKRVCDDLVALGIFNIAEEGVRHDGQITPNVYAIANAATSLFAKSAPLTVRLPSGSEAHAGSTGG